MIAWINLNQSKKDNIVFGLWSLCFLKEKDIDLFLDWSTTNASYLVLVEPLTALSTPSGYE